MCPGIPRGFECDGLYTGDCFIDKRKFVDYSELFNYMKEMTDDDYLDYLHKIESFVRSEKILPYGAEYFVDFVLNALDL